MQSLLKLGPLASEQVRAALAARRPRVAFFREVVVMGARPIVGLLGLVSLATGFVLVAFLKLPALWVVVVGLAVLAYAVFEGGLRASRLLSAALEDVEKQRDEAVAAVHAGAQFSNISVAGSSGVAIGVFHGDPPVLPSLVQPQANEMRAADFPQDSDGVVRDQVFERRLIRGPLVMLNLGGNRFSGCGLGADAEALFWEVLPDRHRVTGVLAIQGCLFHECQFVDVGHAGPREMLNQLRAGLGELPPSQGDSTP
ncbi:MAG TPA: hypothetical protein VJT75_03035 [Thermoleophilaceae bacterium]|nr:hypothetical protein [Thermoleophilaceae bacterium]